MAEEVCLGSFRFISVVGLMSFAYNNVTYKITEDEMCEDDLSKVVECGDDVCCPSAKAVQWPADVVTRSPIRVAQRQPRNRTEFQRSGMRTSAQVEVRGEGVER